MLEDLTDRWYAIVESREIRKGKTLAARRFGEDFVLWRRQDGTVACLPDRCPHRGAALSPGKLRDDCIECPFHGFRFAGDGRCTSIPAQGDEPVAASYRVRPVPVVTEAHGFVWMWRGEPREHYPEPPFFAELGSAYSWSGFSTTWSASYLRVIENQLDFTHLPFIHRNTIGRGMPKQMEVGVSLDGDLLRGWHVGANGEPGGVVHLMLPNVWMLPIGPKMTVFLAYAPIDAEHTKIYARTYQWVVRAPGLRWLLGQVMNVSNRITIGQDQRVVESQTPTRPNAGAPELLVRSDAPIILYRRVLRRERKARPVHLPVADAPSRLRDSA